MAPIKPCNQNVGPWVMLKADFFCQEESAPPEKMLATPVLNTNPNLTLTLNLSQMLTLTIDVFCMLSFVLSAFSHYCVSLLSESK